MPLRWLPVIFVLVKVQQGTVRLNETVPVHECDQANTAQLKLSTAQQKIKGQLTNQNILFL
jgi:hypothetical protein